MRILANENLPKMLIDALRKQDHDVIWVRTDMPGICDKKVMERAVRESRLLLTLDKDFGELAFKTGLTAQCGIILIRIAPKSPEHLTKLIVEALEKRLHWKGHFSVIDERQIRMTPLPRQ